MKRRMILIGASLIMIFFCGIKTEIYGQQACCPDGFTSAEYYRWVNGSCQLSGYTCDRGDECTPCDYWEALGCISSGNFWHAQYCYCETNYCSNHYAELCTSQNRYWDSFLCQCGACNPYMANCGNWILNPDTCGCEPPLPDPCANPHGEYVGTYISYEPDCVDCNLACTPNRWAPATINYIGSDGRLCWTETTYTYYEGSCYTSYNCLYLCNCGWW